MAKSVPDASTDRTPKKRAPRKLPTVDPSPDDLPAIFGHNLKVARLQRGLTLEEVAEAAGVSNQYVSKIEHGAKNITLATMQKLAEIVGYDISGIIRAAQGEATPSSPPSKNKGT